MRAERKKMNGCLFFTFCSRCLGVFAQNGLAVSACLDIISICGKGQGKGTFLWEYPNVLSHLYRTTRIRTVLNLSYREARHQKTLPDDYFVAFFVFFLFFFQ